MHPPSVGVSCEAPGLGLRNPSPRVSRAHALLKGSPQGRHLIETSNQSRCRCGVEFVEVIQQPWFHAFGLEVARTFKLSLILCFQAFVASWAVGGRGISVPRQ